MTISQQKSPVIILRTALQHALDELHRVNAAHACVRPDVTHAAMIALHETFIPDIKHASPTEQRIVGKLVQDILAAGYSLSISDGEAFPLENSTDPDAIYAALASTDSDTIYVHIPDRRGSPHIVLVWGNDAHVISDYSASLSGLLAGANALADELEG